MIESLCIVRKVCVEIREKEFEVEVKKIKEKENGFVFSVYEDIFEKFKEKLMKSFNFEEDIDECSNEKVYVFEKDNFEIIIDSKNILIDDYEEDLHLEFEKDFDF